VAQASQGSTDKRLDEALGHLLRAGVLLAAAVVLLGGILYVASHAGDRIDYGTFTLDMSAGLRHPIDIVCEAFYLQVTAIIQLGLLLLIATPVARVMFTVFAFAKQRDWTYVVITLIVLSLLLYSLFRRP
jgi:uncharacterized membrane protein